MRITKESFNIIAEEIMSACGVEGKESEIQKILEDQGIIEILPEQIGRIFEKNGKKIIFRKWFRQGYVFKDPDAYARGIGPCYVPELSDRIYTKDDFLNICNGQSEIADLVFNAVDWQHPESYLDEEVAIKRCHSCSKLFLDDEDSDQCPHCGSLAAEVSDAAEALDQSSASELDQMDTIEDEDEEFEAEVSDQSSALELDQMDTIEDEDEEFEAEVSDQSSASELDQMNSIKDEDEVIEVTEWCSNCENESTFRWSVKRQGYKAYCPVCGSLMMLCNECMSDPNASCDWNADGLVEEMRKCHRMK